ncbi:MAG: YHS domain-containing (seleno)protein [Granulosicoccus sp.]
MSRLSLFAGVFLLVFSSLSNAAEPVSKSRFGGVAIGGHDTAAYHQLERDPQANATEGAKKFVVKYKGAKWRFATAESAARFEAEPERFEPAYNGHCANALSLGEGLVRTDGTHWEILDDQLYLFYAARGRDRWLDGNWESYKVEADAAWAKLSK